MNERFMIAEYHWMLCTTHAGYPACLTDTLTFTIAVQ